MHTEAPHKLIQFALEWYHVPEHTRKPGSSSTLYTTMSYSSVLKQKSGQQTGFSAVFVYFKAVPSRRPITSRFKPVLESTTSTRSIQSSWMLNNTDFTTLAKAFCWWHYAHSQKSWRLSTTYQHYRQIPQVDKYYRKEKQAKCKSHAMKRLVPNTEQKRRGHNQWRSNWVAWVDNVQRPSELKGPPRDREERKKERKDKKKDKTKKKKERKKKKMEKERKDKDKNEERNFSNIPRRGPNTIYPHKYCSSWKKIWPHWGPNTKI